MTEFYNIVFYMDSNGTERIHKEHLRIDKLAPSYLLARFITETLERLLSPIADYRSREDLKVKVLWLSNDNWESNLNYEINERYEECTLVLVDEHLTKNGLELDYYSTLASVLLLKDNLKVKEPIKDVLLDKVFIVHGRDNLAKTETARFIEKLGFKAIILHEQASAGKTIIEKIEANTNVGFAIVLYTPCDTGGLSDKTLKARARQNVVFEHGYLIAKLGREKVCALVKGDIETPNDINGVVYIELDDHGAWKQSIVREMRHAGYEIDMNKV